MEFNFNDVFNTNFLEKVSGFSFTDAALAITAAFLVGMFIYLVYKKTFGGVMYSRAFNISLVLLTMLTTLVILAITSNVIIALGMVGALSIVRFRTPIKDPMDLVFLFWSIVTGIVIGAGLIPLAVLGSVIIGIILIAFVSRNVIETPYIVIINCADESAEGSAVDLMRKIFSKYRVKSKTVTAGKGIELVYEIRLKNGETRFINELSAIPGITNSALVSFNGEYAS